MRKPKQIVTLLGIGTAVSLLGESTLYTILPVEEYATEMGVTLSMIGILLGANRMVRLLTNGPVGMIYEKYDQRLLLSLSLILGALASFIYSIGFGFWPLFIGRVIWGLGWSLQWIGCRKMILDVSSEDNRATMNGIYQMLFMAGVGFSSLIGSFINSLFGFRMQQQISAFVIFLMAIAWYFMVPRSKYASNSGAKEMKLKMNFNFSDLNWGVVAPAIIVLFVTRFITWGVLSSTVTLWLVSLFGENVILFGTSMTIAALAGGYSAIKFIPSMANAPFIGLISDKLKKRWNVIAVSAIFTICGIFLMTRDGLIIAMVGSFLVAFLGSTPETIVPAVIGDRVAPKSISQTLGLVYFGADLGAMIGPIAALALIDKEVLSLDQVYLLCIVLLIVLFISSVQASKSENSTA